MSEPELLDVVELLVDLPERGVTAGSRGCIVEAFAGGKYEVEFTDGEGETMAQVVLPRSRFIVVWRAQSQSWVTVEEMIAALVANLSEETRLEVFDFARFVYSRRQMAG